MAHKDLTALRHILEAIDLISQFTASGSRILLEDRRTRDAVVFNLAVIGEAVKVLSEELRASHPEIPWRKMAGMRDRLIHGYFAINDILVVEVVEKELPKLRCQIQDLLVEGSVD